MHRNRVNNASNPTYKDTVRGESGCGERGVQRPSYLLPVRASAWHLNFARRRSGYPVDCQIGTAEARLGELGEGEGYCGLPLLLLLLLAPPFSLSTPVSPSLSWDRHPERSQNSGSAPVVVVVAKRFFREEEPTLDRSRVRCVCVCVWRGQVRAAVYILQSFDSILY